MNLFHGGCSCVYLIAITVLSYVRESVSLSVLTRIATKTIYERSHNTGINELSSQSYVCKFHVILNENCEELPRIKFIRRADN